MFDIPPLILGVILGAALGRRTEDKRYTDIWKDK
jgi:hypothetical protein